MDTLTIDAQQLPVDAGAPDRRLLTEEVVEQLRDLIVLGEFAPGAKLNERVLCDRFEELQTPYPKCRTVPGSPAPFPFPSSSATPPA